MTGFKALTSAQLKGFLRDKQTLFWTVLFPLMFLFIFGTIFHDATSSKSKLIEVGNVALVDQMPKAAQDAWSSLFEVTKTNDLNSALDTVRKGEADAALEMKDNALTLHYSQADQVKAAVVQGTVSSFVDNVNIAMSGKPPTYQLTTERVEDKSLKPIQFLTPGILGWAIAMGATFGGALVLVTWRQSKLLRRLRLSPISTGALVASRTLIAITVAMIQMVIFVAVGMGVFGLKLTGSWWMAIPLILCGTLAFLSIGLLAGAVSKTPEAASGLANLIIMPMAFLSGSFIPLEGGPAWLTTVSKFLPLGHLNTGMLDVMVRGQGPSAAVQPMLILLGFALVIGLIATRVFRWED
mgnify:CR=1 FL=1